jgi:hypothetical protein
MRYRNLPDDIFESTRGRALLGSERHRHGAAARCHRRDVGTVFSAGPVD